MPKAHREWHSRGYLPHFDAPGLVQFVTFRLFDSIPADKIEQWKRDFEKEKSEEKKKELREQIERWLDSGFGECFLHRHEIAEIVEDALLMFDGERYNLLCWVVMPNHVHVVVEVNSGNPLESILHSWKSFTAKECNAVLGRAGRFWMPDYFDRSLRSHRQLIRVAEYVHLNPVSAGLVKHAKDWQYSSARYA